MAQNLASAGFSFWWVRFQPLVVFLIGSDPTATITKRQFASITGCHLAAFFVLPTAQPDNREVESMKMDERYSNATYGSAGLAAFFASLSLQDWGFIIGVAFSIVLGVLTYRLNKREQMKRTKILQDILTKTDASNPSATARVIADLSQKAPKEI